MKRPYYYVALCLLFLGLSQLVLAQAKEPIKVIDITNTATRIDFHPATGTPIVFTNKQVLGFEPKSREIIWKIDRSGLQSLSALDPSTESNDYLPYDNTPYALISGSLINVVTGDILIAETEEIQQSNSHYVFVEKDLMLLELGLKGKVKLYGIDIFKSKLLWDVELTEMSAMKQKMSSDDIAEDRAIQPQFTPQGNLLYQRGKDLACIDMNAGKLNWNKEFNPGYIQYSEDDKLMLIANKQKGISFSDVTKYGRILNCIDAVSGESKWKTNPEFDGNIQELIPFDGGILVLHDRGVNIYDYDNPAGLGRWKEDYVLKGIRNIEINEDGLLLLTKKEKFLINSEGENIWKEPKRIDRDKSWWVVDPPGVDWLDGKIIRAENNVTFEKGDKKVTISRGREYLNEERGWIFSYRPIYNDKGALTSYFVELIDANKMEKASISLRATKLFIDRVTFVSSNRIFMNSWQSLKLLEYENGKLTLVDERKYKEPGAGTKKLGKALLGAAYVAGGTAMAFSEIGNSMSSGDQNQSDSYTKRLNTYGDAGDTGAEILARTDKSTLTENYAYFFTKNKEKELVLMKVEMVSAKEVDQFKFTDKTPVYKVDENNDMLYYATDKNLQIFQLN